MCTVFCSYAQNKKFASKEKQQDTLQNKSFDFPAFSKMMPLQFLNILKTNKNDFMFITVKDTFPDNWVTISDIDTLIKLLKSKDTCMCVVGVYSSYLPFRENANLGGYAIEFIKSYKEKKRLNFALWACPKTNEKEADALMEWWTQLRKSKSRGYP
jgi:hypothetical protein